MSNQDFDNLFTFSDDPCYCNGNGDRTQCQLVGHCVCNAGYTGRADFSNSLFSCQINNPAIIVLWSLVILAVVVAYLISIGKVKAMIEKFMRTRARMKKKGKIHRLSSHRGLTVLLLMFGVVLPVLFALAILRIADEDQRVGLSIPFTVLWTILYVTFAIAAHRYTTAIATAMLRAEQSTNTYIAVGRWFGRGLVICQSFLTVLAYPVLFTNGESKIISRICIIVYLGWGVTVFLVTALWSRWVRNQTMLVLSDHPEHDDLKHRMGGMLSGIALSAGIFSLTFLVAVCVPVLWTVHDYYAPILLLSLPIFAVRATGSVAVPAAGGVHATTTVHENTMVRQLMTAADEVPSEVQ